MPTKLPSLTYLLFTLAVAGPARAADAPARTSQGRLATTLSLGGGLEAGSKSNGLSEMELTVGYEFRGVRPELGLVLGLAPNDHAGIRPGVHVDVARLPVYGRAALDFGNERENWKMRWVLLGAGAETRITSEMGFFAEADMGLPMGDEFGLALLVRGGFSLRF
jgi:hypothetical protein